MKVYISTPINGRQEETFEKKYQAAEARTKEIIDKLVKMPEYYYAEFVTTFTLNPLGEVTEAQAMANCVAAIMDADVAIFDNADMKAYNRSNGCQVEQKVAQSYKIPMRWIEEGKCFRDTLYIALTL